MGLTADLGNLFTTQQDANNVIPGGTGDIISNLPALRTATSDTSGSRIDAALLPYLQLGLQRGEQLFFGNPQPSMYPGQTYVSPSSQTLQALGQQEALASQMSPILQQAQQSYLSGMNERSMATPMYQSLFGAAGYQPGASTFGQAASGGFINPAQAGIQNVAGGGFLTGSPYQQQMIAAATRPLVQQYSEQVMPTIASQYSSAGRYGSGAMQQAQSKASESFARGLGDVTAGIVGQDYARERAFQENARQQLAQLGQQDVANRLAGATGLQQAQQAALGTQLAATQGLNQAQQSDLARQLMAAQAAPSFYQMGFLPSQALAQVGAAQEKIASQPLQEAIQRYQFSQQLPYTQLQAYLSSIYGSPMAGSQYPAMPQAQTNPIGSALGGAALGYLGGSLLTNQFGSTAPLWGAGAGALLGGLL